MIVHPNDIIVPHLSSETTSPAAGLLWSFQSPTRTWTEIVTVRLDFATDGTSVLRRVRLEVFDGIDLHFASVCPATQAASLTRNYCFGLQLGDFQTAFYDSFITLPWPAGLLISGGEIFRLNVLNMQAGDQMQKVTIRYRQWLDPLVG